MAHAGVGPHAGGAPADRPNYGATVPVFARFTPAPSLAKRAVALNNAGSVAWLDNAGRTALLPERRRP
jgi:hypothetical protein